MTGDSLHIKYRPKTFDEVLGQQHIMDSLRAVMAEGKQQAFMFVGPSGTGKTTLARICASQLGCTDVVEVDAASNTGVDDMRKVSGQADFVSLDGGNKAFIIDECHRLSKQAWESLLKSIEEPPAGVFWFFCTTEGDKILKTVQTRCVTFTLKSVPFRVLTRLLTTVAALEDFYVEDDVLVAAATEADGSPRQALVNLALVKHTKNEQEAMAALNRAPGSHEAIDLARALAARNTSQAFTLLSDLKDQHPESVRITVFRYALAIGLKDMSNTWIMMVLGEFEKPCVETNAMGDILLRVARLNLKKEKL